MRRLDRKTLGAHLKVMREKCSLTVREVSAETGLSRSAISRAERGHPDGYVIADTIVILCAFFGVDPRNFVKVFHGNTPSGQPTQEVRADG